VTAVRPPLQLELSWKGDLRFSGHVRELEVPLDGDSRSSASPVETLALALASCMASDVVLILTRGRQNVRRMSVRFTGWRAEEDPRRFLRIDMRFLLAGEIEPDKVERALALSREKYCSVWHSMRQDIDLTVGYEIEAPRA
jgi:putative redox protein